MQSNSTLFEAIIKSSENSHKRIITVRPGSEAWAIIFFCIIKVKLSFGAMLAQIPYILVECSRVSTWARFDANGTAITPLYILWYCAIIVSHGLYHYGWPGHVTSRHHVMVLQDVTSCDAVTSQCHSGVTCDATDTPTWHCDVMGLDDTWHGHVAGVTGHLSVTL